MEIKRDLYLNKLIRSMHNGMIKVVTGIRRCGKSYLLFNIFSDYLKTCGVDDTFLRFRANIGFIFEIYLKFNKQTCQNAHTGRLFLR